MTKHILPNVSDSGKWIGEQFINNPDEIVGNLKYLSWDLSEAEFQNKNQ